MTAETADRANIPRSGPIEETALVLGGPGSELVAVLARPSNHAATAPTGVVVVVGGPQTRVGSHRQFVLMARALASAGYACLRFDCTGMGDSPGPKPDFENLTPDIRRACDALLAEAPQCSRIALWGLCDGATAALFYAGQDDRIAAVIAANPWARSDATRSAALVSEHYGSRLRSGEFWKKLALGKMDVLGSLREAVRHAWRARTAAASGPVDSSLPARLVRAVSGPGCPLWLQLSGQDLTAAEFDIAMRGAPAPERASVRTLRLTDADHTFSTPEAWRAVIENTRAALESLAPPGKPTGS